MLPKDILNTDKRNRMFLFIVKSQFFYPAMMRECDVSQQQIYNVLHDWKKGDIIEDANFSGENETIKIEKIKVRVSSLNPALKSHLIRHIHWYKTKSTKFYALCCKWSKAWFGLTDDKFMKMKVKDVLKLGED